MVACHYFRTTLNSKKGSLERLRETLFKLHAKYFRIIELIDNIQSCEASFIHWVNKNRYLKLRKYVCMLSADNEDTESSK